MSAIDDERAQLLDQLAMHLARPDLIVTHRHLPQKRTQPGGTK